MLSCPQRCASACSVHVIGHSDGDCIDGVDGQQRIDALGSDSAVNFGEFFGALRIDVPRTTDLDSGSASSLRVNISDRPASDDPKGKCHSFSIRDLMSEPRTVIVGAGIVGLCTAYELARKGSSVIVLDRGHVADSASCGNAGLFSIGHYPLTRPGASWRGFRWMFDSSSPLWIRPTLSPEVLHWLMTFHRHCNQAHMDRSLATLCAMGWQTIHALEQMLDAESIDCLYRRSGWLDLVMDSRNLPAAAAEGKSLAKYGYVTAAIDGAELRRNDPAFTKDVAGAIHYLDSAIIHPAQLVRGLAAALPRYGVTIRTDATVTSLERDGSGRCVGARLESGEVVRGDTTVLAAGIWSSQLADSAGVSVPMQGARGYHMQLDGVRVLPKTGGVIHETFVAFNPMGNQLRLAGTLEIAPLGRPWMRKRLAALPKAARKAIHGIDGACATQEWAGYRPCTADGMPVIGFAPNIPGLYIATGHAMMGLMLGPVTGRIACADILAADQSIDEKLLAAVRPGRRL